MAKEGVTKSAVNELEVSEREYEHRLRAVKNLDKMKEIEHTWIRVSISVCKNGCVIARYEPLNKKPRKATITVIGKTKYE